MKNFIVALSFCLISASSIATELQILELCVDRPVAKSDIEATGRTVGAWTLEVLQKNRLPFVGTESGFNSILNTPVGDGAIEILSETSMRAYGWCFEVDSVIPDKMPGDFVIQGEKLVRWFFAYSLYDNGKWVSYCDPVFQHKPKFICP